MVLEKTKQIANEKLCSIGIKLKCKVWHLHKGESWSCDTFCRKSHAHIIHLNPLDVKAPTKTTPGNVNSPTLARQTMQHLLLHEMGHVFFCKQVMKRKDPTLLKLFGNVSQRYKRDMSKKFNSPDFISTYAQVHPEDNWVEVFAVYAGFCGDMQKIKKFLKQKKKNNKVLKQFIWMDRFVRNYK
jgi:hypothetical protein